MTDQGDAGRTILRSVQILNCPIRENKRKIYVDIPKYIRSPKYVACKTFTHKVSSGYWINQKDAMGHVVHDGNKKIIQNFIPNPHDQIAAWAGYIYIIIHGTN
jgi:hypothetical protein